MGRISQTAKSAAKKSAAAAGRGTARLAKKGVVAAGRSTARTAEKTIRSGYEAGRRRNDRRTG